MNARNMPVLISIWNFAGHWADCPTWEEKIRIHSLEIKKGSTTLQHAYKLYTRTLSAMSKPCTVVNSWNDHHHHFLKLMIPANFLLKPQILIIFAVISKKKVWSLQNILQMLQNFQALMVHSWIWVWLQEVKRQR